MSGEYIVVYNFVPESDLELALTVGDTVEVIEEHGDGWWEGTSCGHTGFFPRSYVVRRDSIQSPSLPPRPIHLTSNNASAATSEPGGSALISNSSNSEMTGHMDYDTSIAAGEAFSLDSLEAFDELMDRGFAIEIKDKVEGAIALSNGMRVELTCKAMSWDGAATVTHVFSEGSLSLTLGHPDLLPTGLTCAIATLSVGTRAIITCSPPMAYGEAGSPPFVKPNSHVVYDVTISKGDVSEPAPAQGPEELFCSTARIDPLHKSQGRRHSARVTSVVFDGSPITDDLISQAVANGLILESNK